MRTFIQITLLSMIYCAPVNASYFEFCQISGEVVSEPILTGDKITFQIHVLSSVATSCLGSESYTPEVCDNYKNKKYEASLPESWKSKLKVGVKLDLIQQKFDDVKGNRYLSLRLPEHCGNG